MPNLLDRLPGYRIKTVASITGLSAHVIRKWEERYQLLHPLRGRNSYRIYTEVDIQLLLYLKTLLAQGESIGQLAQAGEEDLKRLMQQAPIDLSGIPLEFRNETLEIIQAARVHDSDRIAKIITWWIGRLSLEGAFERIFFPLLRLIGELWHQGGLSISGEHSITQVIRQHLISALRGGSQFGQAQVLIACLPGEHHEIPSLAASLLLQNRGWQVTYLGANVPFDVLQMALRRHHADLMILSCMTEPHKKLAQQWVHALAERFQPHCRVMIGGPGFSAYTDLLTNHNIVHLRQIKDVTTLNPKLCVLN